MKYFIATVALLIGIGFVITAGVIKHRVGEGRAQIAQAEQGVDAVRRLSNLSEYTAPAGDVLTSQAERKIQAGRDKADSYHSLSNWFMAIGVILIVFSVMGFLFFWRKS